MAISSEPETLAFVIIVSYILVISAVAWSIAPLLQDMVLPEQGRITTISEAISQSEDASHTTVERYQGSISRQHSGCIEARLANDITDMKAVNKRLSQTIESLQSSELLTARDQKIARLEGDKSRLTAELAAEKRASARARALQAASDDVAATLLADDEAVRKADAKVSMLKTQNDRAQKLVKSLEAARDTLREDRDELLGTNKRLSSELAKAQAGIEDLETEKEELQIRVVELENRDEEAEWSKLKPIEMSQLVRPARPGLTVKTNYASYESEEEL
ncbi:hypothetical protein LTR86_008016 [Recurvomyces mirabilis]|nr:hypothetical protein LTR86_008016 [Recurvomyces mirabilis]